MKLCDKDMERDIMNMTREMTADVQRPDTPLNADWLKLFAITVMLIDHVGAFLIQTDDPVYRPLRIIGRLAFPIFCFLIAEGAYYTKSMPKYLGRLASFAVISTPPYNLVHGSAWYSSENINVFFTLFFGLAAVYSITGLPQAVFDRLGLSRLAKSRGWCALAGLPLCALCYMAAFWMDTDYGEYGVAAILIFWLLRKHPFAAWMSYAALTFVFFGFLIVTPNMTGGFEYVSITLYNVLTRLLFVPRARLYYYLQIQMYAVLAAVPCMLYNGKRAAYGGKLSQFVKYLFYSFYPAHLFCLWLIQLVTR